MTDVRTLDEAIRAEIAGATVLGGFLQTVAATPDEVALRWKVGGTWQELTWRQYRQRVAEAAAGLAALGLAHGDCVILLSRPRPEPHIAHLAIQAVGGVPVSLHTTLTAEAVADIVEHCQARVAVVEDAAMLDLLAVARERLDVLAAVVVLDETAAGAGEVAWSALAAPVDDAAAALAEAEAGLSAQDLVTLIYTSGTTGEPKGVMIDHANVRWVIAAGFRDSEPSRGERFISYLPFSTVGGRFVDHWSHVILGGAVVNFCPDPALLWDYAVEVRPTLLLGVPAVWQQLYKDITGALEREPDAGRRALLRGCVEVGRQVARLRAAGQSVPAELSEKVAKVTPVLRSLLALVGLDRCKVGVSGGAAVDPEVVRFFAALGLPMSVTWGMTELTTAVTTGGPDGDVGAPYPGVEMRLADDGEVLVRGGLTMRGYYRDPVQTAQVLDADGWLRTGDLGAYDDAGNLRILGRKKEILVLANGMNVAPTPVELALERQPLIAQALAVGDGHAHVAALLTLDAAAARALAAGSAAPESDPAVLAAVGRAVAAANETLGGAEKVRAYRVVPGIWSEQTGELTPTLKKRRPLLMERYAADIAALYDKEFT